MQPSSVEPIASSAVPGTLIGANAFRCHLNYHLFFNTGGDRKPSWKPLSDKGKRTFMVSTNTTNFEAFRGQVMSKINADWEGLGSMVIKAWNAPTEPVLGKKPVVIRWYGSVNGIPGFMKTNSNPLLTNKQYEDWRTTALNSSGRISTVTIKMEKPVSEGQRTKAVSQLLNSYLSIYLAASRLDSFLTVFRLRESAKQSNRYHPSTTHQNLLRLQTE